MARHGTGRDVEANSYYHNIISSYYHIIMLWSHQRVKSFLVPSQRCRHILGRLPRRQGTLPKNKGSSGNEFSRRICQRGLKIHSSSKTLHSWKQKSTPKIFEKKLSQKNFSVEKWNIANHLKRVLPKFRADRSHVRGVNGRSKFRKKNLVSRRSEPCSRGKRPSEIFPSVRIFSVRPKIFGVKHFAARA